MKTVLFSVLVAVLSVAAINTALAQGAQMGMHKNMPVFSDIDLNGDGSVVADEFYQARAKHMAERAKQGGKMKNAGNAPSFEDIDTDGDSEISADEFAAHQAAEMSEKGKHK